jgi:arylsulfatase A-like enzyme
MKRPFVAAFFVAIALLGIFFAVNRDLLRFGKRPPNIIVLLLDTLRADHLGVYGYERDTSPNLDEFAKNNIKFNFAITAAPWTPASVASIFTGMYVSSHGLMPPNSREEARAKSAILDSRHTTLAEALRDGGYATAAISSNPWINRDFAFDQGFTSFFYKPRASADEITASGLKIAATLAQEDKPIFLYLHYLDPHDPYTPPPPFDSKYSGALKEGTYSAEMLSQIARYDGEISYLDAALGKLFGGLRGLGIFDDSVIVIVGDHGEQFEEHGFTRHGNTVYNDEVHVPLLMKLGHTDIPREIDHTVSTVDIYATVLSQAGIQVPPQSAMSVPLMDDERQKARPGVTSRISRILEQRAFVSYDGHKLIIGGKNQGDRPGVEDPTQNVIGVFDSKNDRFETNPLQNQERLAELQAEFRGVSDAANSLSLSHRSVEGSVSEDTLRDLETLGYLSK